ncbi:Uncharacterised protein [Vibrio cholerae]|nr:Uncharacterised protein [Vibrio cholerae]
MATVTLLEPSNRSINGTSTDIAKDVSVVSLK